MPSKINLQTGKAIFDIKGDEIEFDLSSIPDVIKIRLAFYGARKVLSEKGAEFIEALKAGEWEPWKPPEKKWPIIVEAIARTHNVSPDTAEQMWANLNDEDKKKMRHSVRKAFLLVKADRI